MTRYTKSMREAMEEVWANDITLTEGKMKTIATMFAQGKSAEEIAKKMKLPVATVKTILGEDDVKEDMLWEFTDTQITKLKKDYDSLKGAKISLARANQLRNIFDKITDTQLPKLYRADIPFLSTLALSRMIKKGIQVPKGVRLSAFREDAGGETWEQVMGEALQQGYAVRYHLQGKGRLVQAYKTQKDAEHRAKILKAMGGVKDVSITQHKLNFKEYADYIEYMAKNSGEAKVIGNMFKGKTGGGEVNVSGSEVRIDSAKDIENIHRQVMSKYPDINVMTKEEVEYDDLHFAIAGVESDRLQEAIKPFMISYSQYGKHYGFETGDSLAAIQNIAQKLRKKGFTIDKMGRYNPPVDKKLMTGKTGIENDMTPADLERLKKQGFKAKNESLTESVVDAPTPDTGTDEVDKGVAPKKKKFGDLKKENGDKEKESKEALANQVALLKQKLEIEKNKAVKPQPNKDTGEVPLTIGLAHKLLKDKEDKKTKKESVIVKTFKEVWSQMKEGGAKSFLMDVEQDAADGMDLNKLIRKYYGQMGLTADAIKKIYYRVTNEEVKPTPTDFSKIWESSHYTPSQIKQAIEIANKSDGNYTGASKQIEKIVKGLSNHKDVATALRKANESLDERDGANTSSRKGSVWRKAKKWRFGMKVGSNEPKGDKELEEIRIRPKRAVESDLTKSQVKKVHKKADDLPTKSFRDTYGKKKGDSVRYAVATNQTKKKLGIENKNHPAKKKWETLTAKQKKIDLNKNGKVDGKDLKKLRANKEDDHSKDILPKSQEPTQQTDPMNIQTKEPEKKRTDNGTKSDKIDVNPRIDYHA